MLGMERLKNLTKSLDAIIKNIRTEGDFREGFLRIVKLAHSPFVQALISSLNVDSKILDIVFNALLEDKQVADIVGTIANIFECFSVDRFVGVKSETELEDMARKLNEKKLFLAGIYFDDVDPSSTDLRYKLRMDIDNTPITLENRNRFWFPGPDGNFELQMRYHRGFIQIQHIIDRAITKSLVQEENKRLKALYDAEQAAKEEEARRTTTTTTEEPSDTSLESDESSTEIEIGDRANLNETKTAAISVENKNITSPVIPSTSTEHVGFGFDASTDLVGDTTIIPSISIESSSENGNSTALHQLHHNISSHLNSSEAEVKVSDEALADLLEFHDDNEDPKEFVEESANSDDDGKKRKKRQLNLFSLFGGSPEKPKRDDDFPGALKMPEFEVFTKQFPYPKYRKDSFKTGLYLAQSVQLAFFFALIVQVSSAVRNRIWMRESGNSTVGVVFFVVIFNFLKILINFFIFIRKFS